MPDRLRIRAAAEEDVALVLRFIRELAQFERLEHEVVATEDKLRAALFGSRPYAEVVLAELDGEAAGFALYFNSFSTFLAQPGLYLEDLYVTPAARGQGVGRALLGRLAALAVERRCGRLEWAVLDWNTAAIGFYRRLGAELKEEWKTCRVAGAALERLAARR
jgi:GNAT superfamily N-acetyltransferase